ncbi:permease-like cell division protein FtsX [Allobranchiibius sp. CTAmp26]|uniref:permease-like cell division protein FtsX n=1 Tax=Allobranchiibius sp. CTAmp26 TaxID=2815214 RepID=UPI001AA14021|nr:permease-like cell division protein FtsX [Allobranchiibius sp. CTAmp26]MBO1755688.1 permease-like cell division protein FtsX [Allobranchiibius sp. CTAmp26]
MRLQFMLGEIASGIRRNASMMASVVLVSMISLFFIGTGLLAQREVDLAKGYWYDKVQVSVFLCTSQSSDVPSCADGAASPVQTASIKRELLAQQPLVEQVYYESSTQAYSRFKTQFASSPYLSQISPQSMPAAFRVKLSDPKRYGDVASLVSGADGVEAVSDQGKVLDTFFKILNLLSIGAVVLAGLMAVCAVLLMTTTIRQVAFSRRRQVGIMRVVGASNSVIYLPFVIETMVATLLGAVLAIAGLWALIHFGINHLFNHVGNGGDLVSLIGTDDLWAITPWMFLGTVVLALFTAWLTLRRHVRV